MEKVSKRPPELVLNRLAFASSRILRDALKPRPRTREQLWLGRYFQKELLSEKIPDVSLRWVSDEIGWGVFAERNFSKMEFIAEYAGLVRRRRKGDLANAYCFEYPLEIGEWTPYLIDAEEAAGWSRYINHSDRPNLLSALATLEGINHIILYTNETISKGTELCYNYGPDYWKHRKNPR
ncbi:MAG: SET domain-containing protein-lysine N-methyltransferase [Verrucomicrobiota bacterium]|nr:SET domain-containing protein-lysine N-methyltransferase [Verrucomicrobiota bacterium]